MSDFPEYDAVFMKGLHRHVQPLELLLETARRTIAATAVPIVSDKTMTFEGDGGAHHAMDVVMAYRTGSNGGFLPTSIKHRSHSGHLLTLEVDTAIGRSMCVGRESPTLNALRFISTFEGAMRTCHATHRSAKDGAGMKDILKGAALAALLDRPDLQPHIGISATARMPEFAGTIMIPMPNAVSEVIDMHNRSPTAAVIDTSESTATIGSSHNIYAALDRCKLFVDPDEIGEVEMLRLVGRFLSWKDSR